MKDGIDHINIYSKGETELGRWMSNFAYSPIETVDGHFCSIEGYWYWLLTGHPYLRNMSGVKAKRFGQDLLAIGISGASVREDFQDKITKAIYVKALNNPEMLKRLRNTSLPLKHYYRYGDRIVYPGYEWITEVWENIRKADYEELH